MVRLLLCSLLVTQNNQLWAEPPTPAEVSSALRKAATYYHSQVAVHGGYVYHYTEDLSQRWGEGLAHPHQIWIQPPGTPTVGMAFLAAYKATGDTFYLNAAQDAADALVFGQLRSGGWSNAADLHWVKPGQRPIPGAQRKDGNSSLDDGQTQSAIKYLVMADQALDFKDPAIHQSAKTALNALLAAQFPNGGFPQVWRAPVPKKPVLKASFPKYDWRTDGRIKNYWDYYTLNDNVCGYVADTLVTAHQVYRDDKYKVALGRLGDFLLLAQMPEPQPAWAQQYNYEMHPMWARKFEPAAIAGDESQEVIETLMKIHAVIRNPKYLEPIPRALAYLERSLLPNGQLARFYELKTNRPLYMKRVSKKVYQLTFDDSKLPSHYGWKWKSRVHHLRAKYNARLRLGVAYPRSPNVPASEVARILASLDSQGRWLVPYNGEKLVGQPKFPLGSRILSSQVFSQNITSLAEYLEAFHAP